MPWSISRLVPRAAAHLLLPTLLLAGPVAHAQKAPATMMLLETGPPNARYVVPHFASGPDSLRALLSRVQRQASPALTGELFLYLELNKAGRPANAYYLRPPARPATLVARSKEAKDLANQLVAQLPAWQLAPEAAGTPDATIVLPLYFGSSAPAPLLYSDEKPVFPVPAAYSLPRGTQQPYNVKDFLQRQVRYPAEDIRNQVQGTVYAYFEVSETGAIEQRRIVGSLSPSLDAEVLRVLQSLPAALTPPRHQGRPVRVAYVLPLNFRVV
ncbi:MAG: TonB family protein [Hymenobacter sp.]|nr:MAG: TonB family protein [Hymenobacter sp.]